MRLLGAIVLAGCALPSPAAARSCTPPKQPWAAHGTPPAAVVRQLGVLRRPQAHEDRLPRRVLRHVPLQSVDVDAVRVLPRAEGETDRVYAVPGVDRVPKRLTPPRCATRTRGARARNRRVRRRQYMLCLVTVGAKAYGGACRRTHRARVFSPLSLAADYDGRRFRLHDLVPDEVASVEVVLHDGSVHPVPVEDNRWALLFPPGPAKDPSSDEFPPAEVRWLGEDGAVIASHRF